ncbi:discoidin domain-containing protein [Bacillus sp. FJAT-28004]|uniref:discoidin domain-containing protein n=1 Tax=Bacillus sp. FJAT-28004 TaxID=1679165 RepID=UPI0013792763|nr:discoidin domain-containing protein [Bacillus sp. FJAT-28004]
MSNLRTLKNAIGFTFCLVFVLVVMFINGTTTHAAAVGDITGFEKTDDKTFTITSGSDQVKVIFNRDDIVRIWLGVGGDYQTLSGRSSSEPKEPIVIKEDFGPVSLDWSDEGEYYKMATGKFVLRTYKSPLKFAMYKSDNQTVVWEEKSPLNYSATSTTQTLDRGTDEYYYGGGMQNGFFSHRDKTITIAANYGDWGSGTVSNPSPFYLSTAGYGVLRNTFQDGTYNFGSPAELTHDENRFDAYYFYGENFKDILNGYTDLTGKPSLIPRWGMSMGDADCYNTSNTGANKPGKLTTPDVLKVAQGFRANDMPGGWLLPNDGYGCGYVQLPSTVQQLHDLGFYTGLWTQNGLANIATEVGVAGTRLNKLDVAWVGPGYDFALDATRQALQGVEDNSNDRGFVWSVGGWAGTQRYSTVWSGDQSGNWEYIRFHIPSMIGAGLSGMTYATGDVDGIFGGSAQTYVRDLQWKAFTPILMSMSGWASVDKQPWHYGEPYTSYNRDILKLRQRLTPYFYTYLNEAYESGAPFTRAMVYEFPNDPNTKSTLTQYQFMSGESFLVAPVYKDVTVRNGIYLPKGKWIDYWTGTEHYGSKMLDEYSTPLNRLPLLVKAGAIIPMYPETLYDGQVPPNPITYDIYPYKTSSFTMYEDDGVSREHRSGKFAKTVITSIAPETGTGDLKVQVGASIGDYDGKLASRTNMFQIHMHTKPDGIEVGGTSYTEFASKAEWTNAASGWYFDAADKGGIVYVKTPDLPTDQGFELKVAGFAADTTPLTDATVISLPEPDNDPTKIAQEDIVASATSTDTTAPVANALDGSTETIWSTKLDGSTPLPQSITLNLGTKFSVNKLKYLPRQYVGTDGVITAHNIYVSADGTNFTKVASGTWQADKLEKTVTFDTVEAQYVRLEALAGVNGFAAAAELNVYRDGSVAIPLPIPKNELTATATSFQPGDEASNAIDGNSNSLWHTKWDGSDKLPQSIIVDLGKVRSISQFRYAPRLNAANGTITTYKLYVSTDGTKYTQISTGNWELNSAKKYIQFLAVDARYVKLEAAAAVGGYASASEIDVYETPKAPPVLGDIVRGKPATADSEDAAFPASYANDGNPATMWSAADTNPGHVWSADLGKMYAIKGIEISFGLSDKAYKYKLEVREAGSSNWIQVLNRMNNTEAGAVLKDTFGSQGRYVRITITGLPDEATRASIADVKLIGLPIIGTAPVTGVSLNQTKLSMNVMDAPIALEAAVAPLNAANTSVTWSSSDPGVAMVDENGVVIPKGAGSATITVKTEEGGFKASVNVTVTGQTGLVKIPQSQMTATATSFQPGDDPINALDGNSDTWWHIKWYGTDPLPQSIIVNLDGTNTISKLEYMPRQDGGNGTITAYNVYVSQDGVQFTKVATGMWLKNNVVKEVNFAPVRAAYLKLEATEGSGGFASAAELNVYKQVDSLALQAVAFDAASYDVKEGQSAAVKITAQYSDGSKKDVTAQSAFEIANSSFATIANGTITGVSRGETVITATYGGKQATATIVVKGVDPGAPSTALTGSSIVQSGQPLVITYGLNGVTQQVYAADISLTYDPTIMEFISAEPLLSNTSIVQKENDGAGRLRLIVASEGAGHAVSGNVQLLKVTFKSKLSSEVQTTIVAVTDTTLGDEHGSEFKAANSSISVQITPIPAGIPGDMNHDGKVSIGDLGIVAANYGKTSASPDWDSIKHVDSNHDGKIDIMDLAFIARKIIE